MDIVEIILKKLHTNMLGSLSKKASSTFYIIIWWLLAIGVYLLMYFPATNQFFLKGLVPLLLIIVIGKEKRISVDSGLKGYCLLVLWGALSLIYSVNGDMTFRYLQMLTGNIIIWYIVARCIKNIKDIRLLFYPLLLAFVVQMYFTLTAHFQGPQKVINAGLERVSGLSSNENDQGRVMVFGIITALTLQLYFRNKILKALCWFVIGGFIVAIFRTGSRESLITTILGFVIFLYLKAKRKNYLYLTGGVILGVLIYYFGYNYMLNNTAMGRRFQMAMAQGGQNIRMNLIKEGWSYFITHPFLGIGLGSFTTYSPSHHYSHNDFIEILSCMGLPAFLIYITIYIRYIIKSGRLFKTYIGYYKNIIIIAITFVFCYLFLGIWDPTFYYPNTTFMLAFFYSLVVKIYDQYRAGNLFSKRKAQPIYNA